MKCGIKLKLFTKLSYKTDKKLDTKSFVEQRLTKLDDANHVKQFNNKNVNFSSQKNLKCEFQVAGNQMKYRENVIKLQLGTEKRQS